MCLEVPILMDSPEVGSLDGMNPKPYTFRMGGKLCLLLGERSLPLLRSSRCKNSPPPFDLWMFKLI
jgi:hypothetical protein